IRAVYYDAPASFTHSVGVIASKTKDDARLLQFVAVYLRSTLARYFLMMRGWKMLCERNGVHLADVETFPFFPPESAPNVETAQAALAQVGEHLEALRQLPELEQGPRYGQIRDDLDDVVFDYFELTDPERKLIRETVKVLMPSIRPRSFKSLDTPAQHLAHADDFKIYAQALADSLTSWRNRTKGQGRFLVDVVASDPERAGPSGIVRITYDQNITEAPVIDTDVSDELVLQTLAQLRAAGLRAIPSGDFLSLVPDAHLWIDGALYLVRPLTHRSWTIRQAMRDAEQIVRRVQARASREKSEVRA
ncbi:MAG: DNA methylase, partial [Terriglobus roseus]|nr:DNA methylase [Terriglobus roseus]